MIKTFRVLVDGFKIEVIKLKPDQYKTDFGIDDIKRKLSKKYKCPAWYFDLKESDEADECGDQFP